MEKQRIKRLIKSCRRFLIALLIFSAAGTAFSQNITLEQIRQLQLAPEENQNLYTKTDIKFVVTIPNVRPAQIQVLSANQKQDINFRSMRKTENYEQNGTTLELWYNFSTKGTYYLSPLSVMIQNRRRSISFAPVTVTEDPATMSPRIVLRFEDGTKIFSDELNFTNPVLSVKTGKKLHFTVNIQYAIQLVQFNWDIPKDSIFTCTKQYEFTEVKQRERVYSHTLIPVAEFEWTGLIPGKQTLPKIRLNAAGYNGYRSDLLLPEIVVEFTEAEDAQSTEKTSDIFEDAFFQEAEETAKPAAAALTNDECLELSSLYTREHNSFLTYLKARNARIGFEKEHGIIVSASPIFPMVFFYLALAVLLASVICMIFAVHRKHKIRMLLFIVLLIFSTGVLVFCIAKSNERYGITAGCKIYSIPQENAESISEVSAGNRVRILESTEKWYYLEVGETGGWCEAENIYLIK